MVRSKGGDTGPSVAGNHAFVAILLVERLMATNGLGFRV